MVDTLIDLNAVMKALAGRRPVFHSEADFQHALAMELAKQYPEAHVRLEYRPLSDERIYLDLWVCTPSQKIAIELKYKTRSISVAWKEEVFDLANHGAQDIAAYDVWKDVQRIERVCSKRTDVDGYVILLSNDSSYWNGSTSEGTVASAFRVNEGRIVNGGLSWASHTGNGTMKNREKPLDINGTYSIAWRDFFRFGTDPKTVFRYLTIPVKNDGLTLASSGPKTTADVQPVPPPQPTRPASPAQLRSKYSPLYDFLVAYRGDRAELTYVQIEEIIKAPLPPVSRNHPASFWGNTYGTTHVWATKWMDAGWKVDSHSIVSERVVFVRAERTPAPTNLTRNYGTSIEGEPGNR